MPATPSAAALAARTQELAELDSQLKLYSIRQVCELVGISRPTLLAFCDEGSLVSTHRFGRKGIRFSHASVLAFLARYAVKPVPAH